MKTALIFLMFSLFVHESSAQTEDLYPKKSLRLFDEAKSLYQQGEATKALHLISEALELSPSYTDALLLKADIAREIDSTSIQIECLEKALKTGGQVHPKIYYLLGNAYYKEGWYEKSLDNFVLFQKKAEPADQLLRNTSKQIDRCSYALSVQSKPVRFEAENLGDCINTPSDEYWPSLTIDGKTLIFTRLCPAQGKTTIQEDFFQSQQLAGSWQRAEPIKSINTPYNEGAQSISADGKLIFFTACTRSDGFGSCDLYYSRNKSGNWSAPQNAGAPINTGAWDSQPSISANGEYLYFVSNRKGGKGAMDIWRCKLNGFSPIGTPQWGEPENLGDSINTPGNEMSPFIHADGQTLYFASDYWPGMGGFDIFQAKLEKGSSWSKPVNLGFPINTYKDEQGLVVDAFGKSAYYASDRPGSEGMDIYRFDLYPAAQPNPVSYVQGTVVDSKTAKPLCAKVELVDLGNGVLVAKTESCWEKGEFLVCLPLGKEYAFNVSRDGYLFFSENFALRKAHKQDKRFLMTINLDPILEGSTTILRNIFFSTGSFELLPNSKNELNRLVQFLNQNPAIKIEIGGHTDIIGGETLNKTLSENRARAVWQYLVNEGIPASRLSYKGYGFLQPVTTNDTAEGRAQNRRTEFKVVQVQ